MICQDKLVDIGLGCVTFGREIDQSQSFAMMDCAVSCGITFFDTAAAYHHGASEAIIGAWLASRRPKSDQILVATKVLPPYSPEAIMKSVDQSLENLGKNAIDLFYLHSWDNSAKDINVLLMLDKLLKQGKIRMFGASNFTGDQLDEIIQLQISNGLKPFNYVQINHNLAISDLTTKLNDVCKTNQIDIVTYSPLGAGFLTGKYTNGVPVDSRFGIIPGHQNIYFTDQAFKKCEQLRKVSLSSGYSMEHLAMSWALHQSGVKYVLVGGRSPEQLEKAFVAQGFYDKEIFQALEGHNNPIFRL